MDDTPKTETEKAQEAREQGAKAEYDAEDQSALEQEKPVAKSKGRGE